MIVCKSQHGLSSSVSIASSERLQCTNYAYNKTEAAVTIFVAKKHYRYVLEV